MKKNGILKALGILFLIYVVISWLIPTGYYNNGEFTTGTIEPLGLFDIIKYPIINLTSSVFILYAICFLFIGGLYGVMKKTGLYSKLVDNVCSKMKGNEELFLIIITFVLALLSSLTALTLPLFVLVPLISGILLVMGYNKLTALLATVGAILTGNMASTYGFNVSGYIHYFYGTEMNNGILFKIILFALLVGGLILFILILNKNTKLKKPTKEELKEILFYEEIKNNKTKTIGSIIVLVISFILVIIGMYNWFYSFEIDVFNNFHTAIGEVKYNNLSILTYIIGGLGNIGYWNNYEFTAILLIVTFIIGKLGKLKVSEIVDSFIDGMKTMLPVAVFAMFANIIFLCVNSSSTGTIFYSTICNFFFNLSDKLQVLSAFVTSLIGGLLYNDFPYMINIVSTQIMDTYSNLTLVSFIQYSIHGLVQLVAPTSILLVAGLTYFDIPYKDYLKSVWKFILVSFALIVALAIIISSI